MDEEAQAAAARLVRRLMTDIQSPLQFVLVLLASTLTDIAGASKWLNQSWVTYPMTPKFVN